MAIDRLYLIPRHDMPEESLKISEEWNTSFEYNDFFDPALLDDESALKERISLYKGLGRSGKSDTLHGVFYDICINSSDSKIRQISMDRMISSMEIAQQLGCTGVIFHTNIIPGFELPFYLDGWCDRHVDFYSQLCEKYPDINVMVENMFDYRPNELARLAGKMSGVDNFGVCYDVAHGHVHDIPMEEWIESLSPYIKHLHINDNDGSADQHKTVGSGTIDWDKYFEHIDRIGRNIGMLIEVADIRSQEASLLYLKERGYLEKIR